MGHNQDRDVVKIGKKEFVQTTKLNWKAGDNEPVIHMDFARPKLKMQLSMKSSARSQTKPCKKGLHSARKTWDPKKKKFICQTCGHYVK